MLTLQNLWALGAAQLGKEFTPQGFHTTQEKSSTPAHFEICQLKATCPCNSNSIVFQAGLGLFLPPHLSHSQSHSPNPPRAVASLAEGWQKENNTFFLGYSTSSWQKIANICMFIHNALDGALIKFWSIRVYYKLCHSHKQIRKMWTTYNYYEKVA